jgi:hypothetical protein
MTRCALCGFAFDADEQGCRPSCPLAKGCGLKCCPRCGHGIPQEERGLARLVKQALVLLGRST